MSYLREYTWMLRGGRFLLLVAKGVSLSWYGLTQSDFLPVLRISVIGEPLLASSKSPKPKGVRWQLYVPRRNVRSECCLDQTGGGRCS